ncbi:hypothetical protein CAPTEDRAFT_169908 [Capitella teleta]|uniref:IST1 homolog n=1 Tax=Capitella teleta TaxID=283909 RepID=R7U2L4_CAPTE|nr:hypothetical protein CAPTEDRAFT_169908 [Capitella teleta]|eukprot:ELU00235.1 hypothetical protein CAPTEDRAFT_169908 [Capitella teleta]
MFSRGPQYDKLSTNLRLAINRLKLLEKKKTELAVKARREIVEFLNNGKEDRARIRVEHIAREDFLVEAMEIVEMYCDLLLARMGLIQSSKEIDDGLLEPIASIIWATPRLISEVQELKVVKDQLTAKYGKEFVHMCTTNGEGSVNEKLMHKLSVQAIPRPLTDKYLEEIAKCYNVPFSSGSDSIEIDESFENPDNKGGFGGGGGGGAKRASISSPRGNVPFAYPQPHSQTYPQNAPSAPQGGLEVDTLFGDLPSVPNSGNAPGSVSVGGESVDFDDLTKRFDALKKKK